MYFRYVLQNYIYIYKLGGLKHRSFHLFFPCCLINITTPKTSAKYTYMIMMFI